MSPHPLRNRSRDLRKNSTKQENSLWYKYLSTFGLRVYRQRVIGNYIVDFYCHQAKLVIELDGGQHYSDEEMKSDQIRTAYLESQGLKVLQFTNWEVEHQYYQVCEQIKQVAYQRLVELAKD
jgi:very-short-patch-repair endonuclease